MVVGPGAVVGGDVVATVADVVADDAPEVLELPEQALRRSGDERNAQNAQAG